MNKTISGVAQTEPMQAMLTVRDVIKDLLEVKIAAWRALPVSVQDLMLSKPEIFRFHRFQNSGSSQMIPDIIYNGIRFRYEEPANIWRWYSIGE